MLEKLRLDEDEQIGVNVVRRAMEEPLRQIAQNTGVEGGRGTFPSASEEGRELWLHATDTHGDFVKEGVIDPTKVARLMPTTEALIAEIPEKEKAPAGPHPGEMGGGMY